MFLPRTATSSKVGIGDLPDVLEQFHTSNRSSIPPSSSINRYIPDLYGPAHVAGWEPPNLHDLL